MDNLRSVEEIPPPYRNIFTEYPCFNAVQSQVLDDILYTDNSVVVSAPTGSGKTAIFELAIVRLLIQYENLDVCRKIKIVYICPIKALCQERLLDWHRKFSPFGLNSVTVTGDSDNLDFQSLINHNLIISTPEKWDSLTRRWRDHEKIVKVIKLFMIDEVHLLNEENRGSTLEVIVCRMKTVENCRIFSTEENDVFNQKVRFVAVSATVPNVEDIAEWIGKPPNTKYYRFSEEMRPVKLKKIVHGYSYNAKSTSPFKFDISLNYKLPSLIMQYSEGKPTLIFCSTRKSVEMTANHIVQSLRIHLEQGQVQKLLDVANLMTDSKAKATIKHGVGYHHAGMITETRRAIETLFRNGDLPVLVTTSTLAMGVNLPAHLVIVKSTKCYDNGGFRDYTDTAVHQMIGRAGRPQFDTSAVALILTTNEDKVKFENMVGCSQPIESNLHRHLTEHLNAEVVLGTITDLNVAMQWLSSTFLYVRARKNPHHYGINVNFNKTQIDKKLLEMCQIDLNKLVKTSMITMDEDVVIRATVTGKIMAKYYVAFETMKLFTQISGTEILIQILALISKCQEFAPMRLRVNDKKTLNLLNKNSKKNTIRFPLNGRIKTWDMKVNCIIQAVLGNLDILDHSILSESLTIMRNGERIAKCLIEYLETRGTSCYSALLNTTILAKCFHAKLWENSPYVSKQLTGIGSVMSNQLANAGKTTFEKIITSNPRDIELIIKRKAPMGSDIIELVEHIPSYTMTLKKRVDEKQLDLCIVLRNGDRIREKSTVNVNTVMTLLVGDNTNQILLYEKYAHSYMIENDTISRVIKYREDSEVVLAHFISENWVGIDCTSTLEVKPTETGKTSNKVDSVKSPANAKRPSYVQMFLDMYMKKKKTPTGTSSNKEAFPKKAATVEVTLVPKKRHLQSIKKAGSEKSSLTNEEKCPFDGTETPKSAHKHDLELINTIRTEKEAEGSLLRNNEVINKEAKYVPEEKINITKFHPNTKAEKSDLMNKDGESVFSSIENVINNKEGYYDTKAESDVEKFKETKCAKKCESSNTEKYKRRDLEGISDLELENYNCVENPTKDNKESAEPLAGDLLEGFFDVSDSSLFPNEAAEEKTEGESKESVEVTGERCNETEVTKSFIEDTEFQEVEDKEDVGGNIDSTKSSFFTDMDEKVKEKPFMYSISQKYGAALPKRCKSRSQPIKSKDKDKLKMEDIERAMGFEDSLFKPKKRNSIEEFKCPKKKKFSHTAEATYDMPDSTESNGAYAITEILEPKGKDRHETFLGGDLETTLKWQREKGNNFQKSLTWRSPLVFSPAVKHSPNISFHNISHTKSNVEADGQNETNGDTSETSLTSKSNSILTQTVQSTQNEANRKIGQKKCGSPFPLRDKDYGGSLQNNKQDNDVLEICSTSFLEKLGLPSSQYRATPKSRKPHPSPTFNYYSQLLKQPTELKREKIEATPEKVRSENTEIRDSEDKENFYCNYGMYGEVSGHEPLQDISIPQQLVSNAYRDREYNENGFIDPQESIFQNKNDPHPYKPQIKQGFIKDKPQLHSPLCKENFSTKQTNHDRRYPEYNEGYTEPFDDKWLDNSLNSLTYFSNYTNAKQEYDNTLKANHTKKTSGDLCCLENVDYQNQYLHSLEYDQSIKSNKAVYQSMSNPQWSRGRFGDLRSRNALELEPSLQSGRFGGLQKEYAPQQRVSGRYHELQRENVLFDESQNDSASQRGTGFVSSVYGKLHESTFSNSRSEIAPLTRSSSSTGRFDDLDNSRFNGLHSGRCDELQRHNVQQLMSHGRFEEFRDGNTPYHNLSLARSRYDNLHSIGTGNSIREHGTENWESGRLDNWQCDNFNQLRCETVQQSMPSLAGDRLGNLRSEDIPRQRQRFVSNGDGELQIEKGNAQQLRFSGLQGGSCNELQRGNMPQSRSTFVSDRFGEVRNENVPEQGSYLTSGRFNELQGEIASQSNLSFARGKDDAQQTMSSSASNIFGELKGGRPGKLPSEHGVQANVLMLAQNPARDKSLRPRQVHQRPEMLSLQDLNRQSRLHQRKNEDVLNRKNVNVYSMSEVPVPRQEATNEFDIDHNRTVPNFLCHNTKIPKEYTENFFNVTGSSNALITNTPSRHFGNQNLPLPYDVNLDPGLFRDISAIEGNCIRGPSSQYSDFRQGSYQDFSYRARPDVNLNRSFVAQRNYSDFYVEQGHMDNLFQNNDKEYVLNKYFRSLNE